MLEGGRIETFRHRRGLPGGWAFRGGDGLEERAREKIAVSVPCFHARAGLDLSASAVIGWPNLPAASILGR